MRATWWRSVATPVLWLGSAGLLWALGAWLLLVTMSDGLSDMLPEVFVHGALVVALAVGIVISRRSPNGYLVVAVAAVACAVVFAGAFGGGSLMGTVEVLLGALTAVAAVVRWVAGRATESAQPVEGGRSAGQASRSPVEVAAASSLAIAGTLVLARAVLLLLSGLVQLPGAGEHAAGDAVMGLIFFLPIPILAGVALLAAARWLWRQRIGARGATIVWLALVGIAALWLLVVVAFLVGQGNYVYPLGDPLLWAPIGGIVGSLAGVVLLVVIEVRRHARRPAHVAPG